MTEPSQYFKGRTVQEQMNEVIGYVDVRSAEVAVNAIASDVAQVHQDMLDADADASAAAASAAAAAGTLANAVKKTGEASQSIAGDIAVAGNLTGGTVTVPAPVNNTDAANKKYVDDADATKISITNINQYAVGLTGNQGPIGGMKTFSADMQLSTALNRQFQIKATGISTNTSVPSSQSDLSIKYLAGDDSQIANIIVRSSTNGERSIRVILNGTGGQQAVFNLVSIKADGTITYPWS